MAEVTNAWYSPPSNHTRSGKDPVLLSEMNDGRAELLLIEFVTVDTKSQIRFLTGIPVIDNARKKKTCWRVVVRNYHCASGNIAWPTRIEVLCCASKLLTEFG